MRKDLKICFAASSGGHFEQLLMLKPLMNKYNSILVTEKTLYSTETNGIKMYYLIQTNRHEWVFVFKLLVNCIISLDVFFREKPDVVISTGVLSTVPICLIAKLFHKKLVYIESFAKVNTPSVTGRIMYKFADKFYVQWPKMQEVYPGSIYFGGMY